MRRHAAARVLAAPPPASLAVPAALADGPVRSRSWVRDHRAPVTAGAALLAVAVLFSFSRPALPREAALAPSARPGLSKNDSERTRQC